MQSKIDLSNLPANADSEVVGELIDTFVESIEPLLPQGVYAKVGFDNTERQADRLHYYAGQAAAANPEASEEIWDEHARAEKVWTDGTVNPDGLGITFDEPIQVSNGETLQLTYTAEVGDGPPKITTAKARTVSREQQLIEDLIDLSVKQAELLQLYQDTCKHPSWTELGFNRRCVLCRKIQTRNSEGTWI